MRGNKGMTMLKMLNCQKRLLTNSLYMVAGKNHGVLDQYVMSTCERMRHDKGKRIQDRKGGAL